VSSEAKQQITTLQNVNTTTDYFLSLQERMIDWDTTLDEYNLRP